MRDFRETHYLGFRVTIAITENQTKKTEENEIEPAFIQEKCPGPQLACTRTCPTLFNKRLRRRKCTNKVDPFYCFHCGGSQARLANTL